MKKSLASLLVLAFLIWGAFQIDIQKNFTKENCPFCNPSVLRTQMVYREPGCMALIDYKPAVEGHVLVIPERHVERFEDLTTEEVVGMHSLIRKIDRAEKEIFGATGYILLEKNGREAGQSVPHVHFHYLPTKVGDSKAWLIVKVFLSPWLKPISVEEISDLESRFQRHGLAD